MVFWALSPVSPSARSFASSSQMGSSRRPTVTPKDDVLRKLRLRGFLQVVKVKNDPVWQDKLNDLSKRPQQLVVTHTYIYMYSYTCMNTFIYMCVYKQGDNKMWQQSCDNKLWQQSCDSKMWQQNVTTKLWQQNCDNKMRHQNVTTTCDNIMWHLVWHLALRQPMWAHLALRQPMRAAKIRQCKH